MLRGVMGTSKASTISLQADIATASNDRKREREREKQGGRNSRFCTRQKVKDNHSVH